MKGEWSGGEALSHMDLALVLPQNVLRLQKEACAGALVNKPVRTKCICTCVMSHEPERRGKGPGIFSPKEDDFSAENPRQHTVHESTREGNTHPIHRW